MPKRAGAVYMAVLMSSLIVASLAMGAITAAHYFAQDLNEEGEFRQCQIAATAALEWAVADLNATPNWRTARSNNMDTPAQQLGKATIRYRLIDVDGDLADDPFDACDVLATASLGTSTCVWRGTLEPAGAILNCLNYSMAAPQNLELANFTMWCSQGLLGTGGNISVGNGASLTGDCYFAGSTSGDIFGTRNTLTGTLELPNISTLNYYAQNAVAITAAQLPNSFGSLVFDKQLLSANTNTISGTLSPYGIYVIDCENKPITISNSRLHCTLVLKNVGSNSKVSQAVFWEAASANYPALLVQGDFDLSMRRGVLDESSVGINLNPAGTPFRGVADATLSTVYPSQIRGLIYVSGRINLNDALSENEVYGVLIGGEKIRGAGDLFLSYRNIYSQNPPPGFRKFDKVRIAPGSAHRVAAP